MKLNRDKLCCSSDVRYPANLVFDFSKQGKSFSNKIYIEIGTKKNMMYGSIGNSIGYRFMLATTDIYEFCFYAAADTFSIPTKKEYVKHNFYADNVDDLVEKIVDIILDILSE